MIFNDNSRAGTARASQALLTLLASTLLAGQALAFSLSDVDAKAKELAGKSFSAPSGSLPKELGQLKAVDYRKIKFRPETAQWKDLKTPFRLNFLHMGMHYNLPVKINEVTVNSIHPIPYDPARFDFGGLNLTEAATKSLNYAGFNIGYPVNERKRVDEVFSMLGASYFRALGKGQGYGISARGLAIDTGLPSGEEFPFFREVWIERPKPKDSWLTVYALLDSPRATGAYRFIVRPQEETLVDVKAKIYLRSDVGKLGLAPLTSMFLFGSAQPSPQANYRPQLHDSEGLAIQNGDGQWIYRPLHNPRRLSVSSFSAENPKGWGLLQRSREFSRFEDLDEHYEKRPSVWVEPVGKWGKGHVELLEIPSPDESNDNIVAFWVPDDKPVKGQALEIAYRTYWTRDEATHHDPRLAWVKQTREAQGEIRQANLARQPDGSTALLVDFVGPRLAELSADSPVSSQVNTDANTDLLQNNLRYNPETKGWRLTLQVKLKDPTKPAELSAKLLKEKDQNPLKAKDKAKKKSRSKSANKSREKDQAKAGPEDQAKRQEKDVLSETWTYQLPANE